MKSSKKEILILVGIALLFLVLRVPAVHHLYHQDEYKWPLIVNPALTAPGGIPHPPLGEAIYRSTLYAFGGDNFRLTPLLFGLANLLLLYFVVRRRYSIKAAQWSAAIFAFSFYSVLASLMVDTDGQIMPFFFLAALWFYDSFNLSQTKRKWLSLALFLGSLVLGLLVKASFVLAIGAFAFDFLIEKNIFKDKKKLLKAFGFGALSILALALLVYLSKFIFPFFNLQSAFKYWESFVRGFGSRNFLQTGIQFAKALLYLSPALVLAGLASLYPYRKEHRLFHIFVGFGLLFYLVIFDFSKGALDRYFQFLIIPLCVIAGAMLTQIFENGKSKLERWDFISISIITLSIFALQFFDQLVPALYPKTEWLGRIFSLKWNFLFPFTGGSGPTGFYVSFLFIALIWISSLVFCLSALKIKGAGKKAAFCILLLGILYNGVFIEEYLFGRINGSVYRLFAPAEQFIVKEDDIKKVIVYNDIGGYEIQKTGKYERRLYAAPQFEENYRQIFGGFSGHVLYIDLPRIAPNSLYADYLSSCKSIYAAQDKYLTAKVLDCRK